MNNPPDKLPSLIADFAKVSPPELVLEVIESLKTWDSVNWEFSRTKLLSKIHSPQVKADLNNLLHQWKNELPQLTGCSLAFALEAALAAIQQYQNTTIELAWTGPVTATAPLRRTDQALLQLIEGAKETLLIVSFAVYKADEIIIALENAIQRGVCVQICLEDSDEGKGKIAFSGIAAFDRNIFRLASFYYWPLDKRPKTAEGKFGSLHAKLAVADRETIFISSANLTEYAMDLNMEMGVLINDANLGGQVERLFTDLIVQKALVKTTKA